MRKLLFFLVLSFLLSAIGALADPTGANVTNISTETKAPSPAGYLNTSGGTFTTIILSAESQNMKWKAYAGNVTGVLTLDDSGSYSIYQWAATAITGEVFATRNNSISWPSVRCASQNEIYAEDTAMNHTSASSDSINNTFRYRLHKTFFIGSNQITNSTCRSTFTWVNDNPQTPSEAAPFQEMLLHDGSSLIYSTSIDDNTLGFNNNRYDFQMILAEKGVNGYPATRYYFYMELQ